MPGPVITEDSLWDIEKNLYFAKHEPDTREALNTAIDINRRLVTLLMDLTERVEQLEKVLGGNSK